MYLDSVIILIVAIVLVLSQVIGPLTRSRHVQGFQSSEAALAERVIG